LATGKLLVAYLFGNDEEVLLEIAVGRGHDHLGEHSVQRTKEIHGDIAGGQTVSRLIGQL
jgi:hypothetical protein